MAEDLTPELGAGGGRELERLMFFTDAVVAIAITLLVIDLRLPDALDATASDTALREALASLGQRFLSVLVSFCVIALWWSGQNRLFRSLAKSDGVLLVLNFVFLAAIVFLPFPTDVIGRFANLPSAVVLYAATNSVAGWSLVAMRLRADRAGYIRDVPLLERRRRIALAAVPPLTFVATMPLAALDPRVATFAWILMVPASLAVRQWFARKARVAPGAAPGPAAGGDATAG